MASGGEGHFLGLGQVTQLSEDEELGCWETRLHAT